MRTLGHMLAIIFLALLAGVTSWVLWSNLFVAEPFGGNKSFKDVVRSTTYVLPSEGWLEFPLPNSNGLRVLSTALVGTDESLLTDQRWGYTLGYQLVGHGGKLLKEWTYHFRTGVTRYIDPETGRYQPRSYVADIQATPADSRMITVSSRDLADATGIRIRLLDQHPGLQHVLVRCYARESVAEHKLAFLWQRLDDSKRERIARVSVFGAEFLRDKEQYNLLRWEWSPIGPAGVHEEDYQSRVLFVLNDALGETVDEDVLPEGIYADSLTRGMLALPEGVWDLRLEVVAVDPKIKANDSSPVRIRWYGKGGMEKWEVGLAYHRNLPYLRESLSTGLLEVDSDLPVIVRVYLSGGDQSFMLRSEEKRLRTYLAQEGQPVEYRIEHVKGTATPFRIDLRSVWRDGEPLMRRVRYKLLDEAKRELGAGEIVVEQPPSVYDRVSNPVSGERITEAVRRYLYLSEEVSTLQLSATEPVIVSAYSRPDDLPRRVRVPEDYQELPWDPEKQPAWFMVRPLDHELLRLQQRSLQIVLQPRPPELDPQLIAGRYEWKEYQPNGKWRARELFVPRTSDHTVPGRSRAGVFRSISTNNAVTLRLQGQTGRHQVAPTLIFVGSDSVPADVSVELDGEVIATTRIFSPRTRLRLPLLPVGDHTMQIRTSAVGSWWINYAGAGEDGHLLRKVVRLSDDALSFDFTKQGGQEEVISGAIFCAVPGRVELRVNVDTVRKPGMSLKSDWTFLNRSFDVDVEPQRTIPMLDTPDISVSPGQTFFLPLGEDLKAGDYRISMTMLSGEPCHLNVHQVISGQPLLRRFFRESDLTAAGEIQ